MSRLAKGLKRFARETPGLHETLVFALSLPRLRKTPKRGEIRTLCYHGVAPDLAPNFSRQLRKLRDYGQFIGPDEALSLLSGDPFDGRYFLVTFDDGFQSTVANALPVLVDQNITALMFVISDFLSNPPQEGFVTEEGCRDWLQAGMVIGSHTNRHRRLATLSKPEAMEELSVSHQVLSKLCGTPIKHFACPWGVPDVDFESDRDPILAREVGYATFFTTTRGPARRSADLFGLPRDVVEPHWGAWRFRYFFGEI